ncbi:hypothetical protein ACPCG0_09505 [Propionibacteriaceae bacterium Y1923]|uniref:hypothetical protein n=1 Tax=Aestuariimicrobium sp. Y1814 TaxID=3418742 RepID=UPI003C16E84D
MTLSIDTATFFDDRVLKLAVLVKQSLVRLVSDTPAEDILGLGLLTDPAAEHLAPAIYRRGDHEANLRSAHVRYPDDPVDWDLYLRWSPVEWPHSTTNVPTAAVPGLATLWDELLARRATASGVDRTYWPSIMFELAANALVVLHRDGWFEEYPHSVHRLQVVKGRTDKPTRRRWAEQMNTPEHYASYLSHEKQFVGPRR